MSKRERLEERFRDKQKMVKGMKTVAETKPPREMAEKQTRENEMQRQEDENESPNIPIRKRNRKSPNQNERDEKNIPVLQVDYSIRKFDNQPIVQGQEGERMNHIV